MSSSRIRLNHDAYRVGWISALPLEKTAAIAMLDADHAPLPQPKSDNNTYHLGEIGDHNIVIACLPSGRYGLTSAAVVSQQMLSTFPSIEIGLMVGIGGGVPSTAADIRLGDIVVSKPTGLFPGVVQYDYGKAMGDGSFHRTGSLNNPPDRLLTAISDLEANHRLGNNNTPLHLDNAAKMYPSMKASFTYPGVNEDILFKASYVHEDDQPSCNSCDPGQVVPRSPRESTTPFIHHGLIASANQVMKNARTRDKLGEELGILCFEMEAAGLMNHFPCLVIRGICDYSDSHKNKQWQDYAAATAAAYARELLESSLPTTLLPSASDAVRIRSKIPISKSVFFGRKEELHQIQQLFDVEMHQRQVAVIWGPSGYGKTQLALEYLTSRDMGYEVVLWIDSSSRTMVEESFEQISLHLGSRTKSMKSGVDRVVEWLGRQSQSWIIVFDGIESMEDDDTVDDFDIRDYFPACKHGHLLLVTTSSDLHLRLAYPGIEIQGVDDQTGASILLKCAGIASEQTSNNTAGMAISRKLGGIPLAIEQAGSYLSYGMSSMADYKKHLETRFRDCTLKTPMRKYVGSYEKGRTLWTTFDMLYYALEQQSTGSARLLHLVAFLGRGRIPFGIISGDQEGPVQPASEQSELDHLANEQLSLIVPWLMELRSQTIELAMAVRQLEVSGFVKFHRREGDTLIESLTLHDLARSFLQSKISQEDRLDMIASSFLLNGRQLYDGEQVPEEDIIRRNMGRLSVVLDQFQALIPNSMLQPPDGRFFQLCGAVAPLFARVFRYREQLKQAAQFWDIAIQHRALSVEGVPHLEGLMEAAEIDSRIGDLEGAIRKYSTIVSFCASNNVAGENIYIRAAGRLRECRESLRRREQDSVRAAVATSAPKRMRQTATDVGGARDRNRQTWEEYIQDDEDEEWLQRSDFEEIIHLDGPDAAMALAYMASTLRNYYNYYHAQPRRPKDDGKYWGIFRQALGDDSVAGKSFPAAPYASRKAAPSASRKAAPPAVTIVKDLNFARSWATTFGSTALNDWLSSKDGPANFNSLAQGQTGMIDMLVQANETHTALCWAVLQPPTICNEILHGLMAIENFNPGRLLLEVMRRPGSRTAIRVTLNLGVSVNCPDYIKNTALLCAARANNVTAVTDLLSGGSNVCHRNATGDTALHIAAQAGNFPLLGPLLRQGAVVSQTNDAGRTALHEAVAAEKYTTAGILLRRGSSVKATDNEGQAALHIAVQRNVEPNLQLLDELFDYGASLTQQDNNGRTALHYAAAKHPQHIDMVRLLIQRHCKQQGRLQQFLWPSTKKVINMRDRDGRTAVHEAQRAGNMDISLILDGNLFT